MIQVLTSKPNNQYLPPIEAGLKIGLRPSAVLLRDHYALNRSVFHWDRVDGEPQWKSWDYAILTAVSSLEAFKTETGQYLWWDESDDVVWKVKLINSPSKAALDRYANSERGKNLQPGEAMTVYPVLDPEADEPSFLEWMLKDTD